MQQLKDDSLEQGITITTVTTLQPDLKRNREIRVLLLTFKRSKNHHSILLWSSRTWTRSYKTFQRSVVTIC